MTKLEILDKIQRLFEREFNVSETLDLIQRTNIQVYWSWGVDNILQFEDKGLLIRTNGFHHTGYVLIVLAWNDTYSYYLLNDDWSIKKQAKEVYFDELQYRIDKDVERLDLYEF